MQVLKLTWVPTGQVFAQPKTFEEAIATATTRALRAGKRSIVVQMGDDGDSFDLFDGHGAVTMGVGFTFDQSAKMVACEPGTRVHHFAGTGLKAAENQRSELQSIAGKPPGSGWYKGRNRRFDLAAGDPRRGGPYYLVFIDADDKPLIHQDIEPMVRTAGMAGASYPLDAVLAGAEIGKMLQDAREQGATFALVLRDDDAPKLKFRDKWDGAPRSMQVVYRRPL